MPYYFILFLVNHIFPFQLQLRVKILPHNIAKGKVTPIGMTLFKKNVFLQGRQIYSPTATWFLLKGMPILNHY